MYQRQHRGTGSLCEATFYFLGMAWRCQGPPIVLNMLTFSVWVWPNVFNQLPSDGQHRSFPVLCYYQWNCSNNIFQESLCICLVNAEEFIYWRVVSVSKVYMFVLLVLITSLYSAMCRGVSVGSAHSHCGWQAFYRHSTINNFLCPMYALIPIAP